MPNHLSLLLSCIVLSFALDAQNCTAPFDLGNDTVVCNNLAVQLTPDNFPLNPLEVNWFPTTGLTIAFDGSSASALPSSPTTYRLDIRTVTGPELVFNGDFSMGDTGFTSQYTFGNSTGGNGPLDGEGQYRVTNSPTSVHNNYANCGDQTNGSGNMMVVNGADSPVNVWCQNITVSPGETYAFGAFVTSVVSENPAILQFRINGQLLGAPFTALPANCVWSEFFALWESGASTSAEICISNQNIIDAGNDFAIDEITFRRTCLNTDSITVTPTLPPTIGFTIPDSICENSPPVSLLSLLDGSTPINGSFQLNGTPVSGDLDPSQIGAGDYLLNYTAGTLGCQGSAGTQVSILAAASAGDFFDGLTDEAVLCNFSSLVYNAHTLVGFSGDPGGFFTISGGPAPASIDQQSGEISWSAPPAQPSTYTVTYQIPAQGECPGDATSFTLNVIPPPALDIGGDQAIDCTVESVSLTNFAGATAGFNYEWRYNGTFLATGINSIATQAGIYQLFARNPDTGCADSLSINIADLRNTASMSVQINQPNCGAGNSLINGSVAVTGVAGGTEPFLYRIDGGVWVADSVFNNLDAGTYTVEIEDAGGCTASEVVTLNDPRSFLFQLNPRGVVSIEFGNTVPVSVQSDLPDTVLDSVAWFPPGTAGRDNNRIIADPAESLFYFALVTSPEGCVFSDSVRLAPFLPNVIYAPNAFSPNGDGINDNWIPFAHPGVSAVRNIQIYDRWGGVVFEQAELTGNDPSQGWNGRRNGKPVPIGAYSWTLEAELFDGRLQRFSGEVMVLR